MHFSAHLYQIHSLGIEIRVEDIRTQAGIAV